MPKPLMTARAREVYRVILDPTMNALLKKADKDHPATTKRAAQKFDLMLTQHTRRSKIAKKMRDPSCHPWMPASQPVWTSERAAREMIAYAGIQNEYLYYLLQEVGPLADFEIEKLTGWQQNTVHPRRNELDTYGCIIPIGHRIHFMPNSEKLCLVWQTTDIPPPDKATRALMRKMDDDAKKAGEPPCSLEWWYEKIGLADDLRGLL